MKVLFPRTQKIELSPIKQIELMASNIPDVISLAQGIPSFDTPEVVKKAAIKALNKGLVAKYSLTYGLPELRETIEEKLAEEGMYYDFENEIVVTAGSIEAITASLVTIIDGKKNEVILFSPSYASYTEAVKVAGGKPVFVNLDERNDWSIDFALLAKKITANTAGILFANPNNPTGTVIPKEDLLKIAELAEKKKFYIISDEVYKDFLYDEYAEQTLFSLAQLPQLRKRVIRVFSLSKAYAMTGWRVGFVHSDEEVIKEIVKVHDAMVTCAPVISQYAAIAALDFADKDIERFRKEYSRRRDITMAHLDELSEFFDYHRPSGAYFVFPRLLPKRDSWQFAQDLLEKEGVAVVPGVAFGPNGESHVRISFGRTEQDIDRAFDRIKHYFKKQ